MNISIDYDETYTRDPKMWDQIIATMRARGHRVYCVTMRRPREAAGMEGIAAAVEEVVYTSRHAKEPWCRANDIKIDVWIDDSPAWLLRDAL